MIRVLLVDDQEVIREGLKSLIATDAGLTVDEVPVNMRERASGESKLRGAKAVQLVFTVFATLVAAEGIRRVIANRKKR